MTATLSNVAEGPLKHRCGRCWGHAGAGVLGALGACLQRLQQSGLACAGHLVSRARAGLFLSSWRASGPGERRGCGQFWYLAQISKVP